MKISEFVTRRSSLTEPTSIQLPPNLQDSKDKLSAQQDNLSQVLVGLGMKYSRCGNNVSVSRVDYIRLKQCNLAIQAVYQRSKSELENPVLIYILKKNSADENNLLGTERVISRLEEVGLFYALPKEESLSLYLLIEKDSVAKFRKWIRRRYRQSVGVFFPSVKQ